MAANLAINDRDTANQFTSIGESIFNTDFPFLDNAEIRVSVDQVDQVLGVDYNLSGLGAGGGFTVTFTSATTIGELITVWQDMPFVRLTGFSTGAAVLAGEDLNTEFVRQIRHDQQIRRDIRAALRLAPDDTQAAVDMELPSKTTRAGKALAFDAAGKPTVVTLVSSEDASLRADLAANDVVKGAALIGDPKPYATAFLQTLSDIINGEDISILRFITTASAEHSKIRARTSTTDHTADFNDAITELNAVTGGKLIVPYGDYNAEDIVPKQAVTIVGDHDGVLAPSPTILKGSRIVSLGNGSHIINQTAGSLNSFSLKGLVFQGPGAAIAGRALSFTDMTRLSVASCAFNNFADEALFIALGNAAVLTKLMAQNCLLDRTRAAKIGVIHLLGNDHIFQMSEITASSTSLSDANQYICAIFLGGSNHFLESVIGEISDVGIHAACTRSRFSLIRCDLNYGHGFELAAGGNTIATSHFLNNSQAALNTHSGFRATAGSNLITGCLSDGVAATRHKFGFEDTINSDSSKNRYVNSQAVNFGTKSFKTEDFAGAMVDFGDAGPFKSFVDGDTTPSVDQYNSWRFTNTAATNVTTFDDGVSGQVITLLGETDTTLINGATLKTNTGANKTLAANTIYRFKLYNLIWYEQE